MVTRKRMLMRDGRFVRYLADGEHHRCTDDGESLHFELTFAGDEFNGMDKFQQWHRVNEAINESVRAEAEFNAAVERQQLADRERRQAADTRLSTAWKNANATLNAAIADADAAERARLEAYDWDRQHPGIPQRKAAWVQR